ncbi:calyx/pep [Lambdina fiscellaria nucleopolyhedrovirus]|uniref:Calyx/pep n=1 Tax=Lambdina fiscellaria nucleopolyhedrovirus TaxID=1642929 RepID=A0A0E3URP9_9ABAC|nr:calyx/pep [Lambdina fiscellaria nucleopolyhedrovirus]AKC91659.1 calyx/pep [Lambdina fiscellaria nucleopolyhedrovirus]
MRQRQNAKSIVNASALHFKYTIKKLRKRYNIMSFSVITKKYQDLPITAFLDHSWVLWVCADDVLQLLRLPASVLQTVPGRHKRCWNDFSRTFNNQSASLNSTAVAPTTTTTTASSSLASAAATPNFNNTVSSSNSALSCRFDNNRLFIDNYGLGNLCNRVNSSLSDYLATLFVAEVYREAAADEQNNCNGGGNNVLPPYFPTPDCRPPFPPPDCKPPPPHDILERISRQNDLILNGLGQMCINNTNQHLELSNLLTAIRLQNVTINGQLTQLLETLDSQLSTIVADVRVVLDRLDARFEALLVALESSLAKLQDVVRNELTGINSILNNLTSTVTNINCTLNNVLQAINALNLDALTGNVEEIQNNVREILSILTPTINNAIKDNINKNKTQ